MPLDHECIIVGAGFVGATLAIALSKVGIRPLVIDSRLPLDDVANADVRGIALAPSSKRLLDDLGIWSDLADDAQPIKKIRVTERGSFGSVTLDAEDVALASLADVVPADHLLRTLERHLISNVSVRWGTSIASIGSTNEHRTKISLDTRGSASRESLDMGLLVAADGANSNIRRLLNIETSSELYGQSAIVSTVTVIGAEQGTAYERFTADGPIALLPSANERHVLIRCCKQQDEEKLLAMSETEYLSDVLSRFGKPPGKFQDLGRRTSHPLRLVKANSVTKDRAILVGAAAVSVHPNAAQGLNLGFRDVVSLTQCFCEAKDNGDNVNGQYVLEEYQRRRQADHRATVRLTDGLASGFSSSILPVRIARGAAMMACAHLPSLRRHLIYQGIGAGRDTRLPNLKIVDGDA